MARPFEPMDLNRVRTYPLANRHSKVSRADFGRPWHPGGAFNRFLDSLPNILAGRDLRNVIHAWADACRAKRTVLIGMGAHVIKVGLNPVVIDLMERGLITGVALNGAGIIHDLEIAMVGRTSEDVAASLNDGSFGMVQETCEFLSAAVSSAAKRSLGLGEAVGEAIRSAKLPERRLSILAAGHRCNIPVTVHVALGTDILHMHPRFDPEAAGGASHRDFRTFAAMVASLSDGLYLNVGSAVVLPEVFLKAVTLARNLGHPVERLTTVNLDFIRQYRPLTNVVQRPTSEGGRGFNLVGHHEILLPLIAAGLIETLCR